MTDTPTAGLEKRLRDLAAQIDPCLVGGQDARLLTQTADALAKARDVIIQRQFNGYNTVTDEIFCTDCGALSQTNAHNPNCPIGAALEAMK